MTGFVTLGHLLFMGDGAKKVTKGDKANHGWEMGKHPVNFCAPLK